MLVDINAYVGQWPFKRLKYNTCALLLERMNKFGVDVTVISSLNGVFYKNTQSANEALYDEMGSDRRFGGRFIPFAVINPIYAGWRDDLKTCCDKMGMKGIRLHPLYHDYEINDPSLIELVKYARDRGLVVAFSLRMVDSRQRSWMDVSKEWELKDIVPIVKAVPDAKFFILNLANSLKLKDEESDCMKKANVLFDTSGREIKKLYELLAQFGKDKFAFGTHSPILDYVTGLLRIEAIRENEADFTTKELLRSGNARKILGV